MKTNVIKEIIPNPGLISFCGLYCGACRSYLNGKCPGCRENVKAAWCKVRTCCLEGDLQSCADCKTTGLMECRKYNNFISKIFGILFNSDRPACIARIKEIGYEDFAAEMAASKIQTIRKR
jgi:hypothetical protein